MGTKKDKIEKIMILGGGRVGFKVAKELSNDGYSVKLIEINPSNSFWRINFNFAYFFILPDFIEKQPLLSDCL